MKSSKLSLFEILSSLEKNTDIHLGRLLILLNEFTDNGEVHLEGLTKLAKLDFLLRYPLYLEKALLAKNKSTKNLNILDFEKLSIESKMIRYKYGPWDPKYREFINILIGKGLTYFYVEGRTINIGLTEKGVKVADRLLKENINKFIAERSKILKQHFDYSGTYLMNFIYKTFPEITTLGYGKQIDYEN
ncbi:MAG: hypothetical protein ACFFDN_22430 [Candidatus Hodarchaeota archaeon]